MKVLVLMSTYNGETFLKEQINSILNQKKSENMDIEIYVRDDGSSDSTKKILNMYQKGNKLRWYEGNNIKPAKSFWELLRNASDADYYLFCDQDDVWFEDKVLRAVEMIGDAENPTLYCSDVIVTDKYLKSIENEKVKSMPFTDFAHSLIYSLAPGCTFVFNNAARNELVKYNMDTEAELIHDWLAHKIIALRGDIIYDMVPSMYYRQHGNNTIGIQSGISGTIRRIKRFIKDKSCVRSKAAKSILNVFLDELPKDSNKYKYLNMVANYRCDKELKRAFLKEKAFRKNNIKDIYLIMLIRMERI